MEALPLQPLFLDPMRFPTPEAQCEEALRIADMAGAMAVIVWADDARRSRKLRELAAERAGHYFECQRYRTGKRFSFALAAALGLPTNGTQADLDQRVEDHLARHPVPLFLDYADRLTERQLRGLRDWYDMADARIVLAGATERLFALADDRATGGQFYSRCVRCPVDAPTNACPDADTAEEADGIAGQISPA